MKYCQMISRSVITKQSAKTNGISLLSVADPGFQDGGGGANPCVWGENILFDKIFVEN